MWPVVFTFMRSNARQVLAISNSKYFLIHINNYRFVVLPIALVVGALGYAVESLVRGGPTPYPQSIEQTRIERLTSAEALSRATDVKKQLYENVLDKNLSESLSRK